MTFDMPEVLDLSGKAGEDISIGFTIHNNGNGAEIVYVEGPAHWRTGPLIPGPYTIKPYDTRNGTMRIEIPERTPFGPYQLTFTLRSEAEGEEGNVLGVYEIYVSVVKEPEPSDPGPPLGLYAGVTGLILILIVVTVLLVKRKGSKRPRKGQVVDDDEDEDSEE